MKRVLLPVFLSCLSVALFLGNGVGDERGASVVGLVTFQGTVPLPLKVAVTRDREFCGATVTVQPLFVGGPLSGLRNAVVSLERLDVHQAPEAPQKVVIPITNLGCAFTPHVRAVTVGSVLEIRNEDPILHNTHIRAGNRTVLNVVMVAGGLPVRKELKYSGVLSVKCDAHDFMSGYVLAFNHPFFQVTNEAGEFRIAEIPPGRYALAVWHETLGTLRREVVIPASGEVVVNFHYRS